MIPARRQRRLLEILAADGAIAIAATARALGVSRETIRRDVNDLAAAGKLAKSRGGAVPMERQEDDRTERAARNPAGKRKIGRLAAGLVRDGASLFIDSGSTTACLAEALAGRRRLTVYTPDLAIGRLLAVGGHHVILLGGTLIAAEGATVGPDAVDTALRYRADLAFVGAGGLTLDGRLTDFTRDGAALRGAMMRQAARTYVLLDRDKLGQATPVVIPEFASVAALVTDRAPPPKLGQRLRALGVDLLIA